MRSKAVCILQRKNQFIAGIFSSKGLYATCLPRPSLEEAILAVDGFDIPQSQNQEYLQVLNMIFDIFEGKPDNSINEIKLDFSDLTAKQITVYKATMSIPYGTTISYGHLAEKSGLPGAARFVGNVMANNRFAPIVPCHRVVSSSGIGGYGRGIDEKIQFLEREGAFAD